MIGTLTGHRALMDDYPCFSLLLAELMIGTFLTKSLGIHFIMFQSPISGVNDWNSTSPVYEGKEIAFQSPISGVNDWNQAGACIRPRRQKVSVSY